MITVVFPNEYVATYTDDEIGRRMIKKGECVEVKQAQKIEPEKPIAQDRIKPNLGKK